VRSPLDPLRYGVRALEEMARAEASVPMPARSDDLVFAPHPLLRPVARDGVALSLRMFCERGCERGSERGSERSDDVDDATQFVMRSARTLSWRPLPPRVTSFFEAHAAAQAAGDDDDLLVGFPLVSFVQAGQRRTAPLFSWSGARATWLLDDDKPWRLPHNARLGTPVAAPSALQLHGADDVRDDDDAPTHSLHGGLWHKLFQLDPADLQLLYGVARAGIGPLVRAATALLSGAFHDDAISTADVTLPSREDVRALCDVVNARAQRSLSVQAHAHGVVLLLPRGDPTSGLRAELRSLLEQASPRHGPLAVYLGSSPGDARSTSSPLVTHGPTAPTASQIAAAESFMGSRDLVALQGPPGCGKTTLLHHLGALAIVERALDDTWRKAPALNAPWSLVVTSTNNGAVDQALAPFVRDASFPIGLRVGNRKTLADVTAQTLRAVLKALAVDDGPTLIDARATFEHAAQPLRAHHAVLAEHARAQRQHRDQLEQLVVRETALRKRIAQPHVSVPDDVHGDDVKVAREALLVHAQAATLVVQLHVEGRTPSLERARKKWGEANALRRPKVEPVLTRLGLAVPFADVGGDDVTTVLFAQRAAMEHTVDALKHIESALELPGLRAELHEVTTAIEALTLDDVVHTAPPPDPALVALALDVRSAWARAHRAALVPRLQEALACVEGEGKPERGRTQADVLQSLSPLFPVAGCTLLSWRASFPLARDVVDRVVVDEAGQCAPIYAVPALHRATRALITGDTAQLPPVYSLDDRTDARLARDFDAGCCAPFRMGQSAVTSSQAVAEARAPLRLGLVEHFRSQPPIVELSSCWSGHVLDVRTPTRSLSTTTRHLSRAVLVHDVVGHGERAPEGIVNAAEAHAVVTLVDALVHDGVVAHDIAVLTPFVGQSARIERELQKRGLVHERGVLVRTVHKLQGGERRVVIFSVVATDTRHLRFLTARPHLLHVATSRAQDHLVVFLDVTRAQSEPQLQPFVDVHRAQHAR
jgi:hypothetical protein